MRLRAAVVLALFFSALPVSSGALTSSACASERPRAALVVDTGSGVHRFCVDLPQDSVSGIDVIKLAGAQHGLQYKLGFGGQAVCQLAGVGPEGDDCFADDPYFWGYWRGDGSGGWTWSSSGAGSTSVQDGGVEGWSWGTGRDGNSHPKPPATTFDSVCVPIPAESGGSKDTPSSGGSSDEGKRPSAAEGSVSPKEERDETADRDEKKKRKKRKKRDRRAEDVERPVAVRADGTESPVSMWTSEPLPAADTEESDPGPPRAGLAGLAAAALLGLIGARRARRRIGRR